ncbi:AraC family transcriptional regulator [Dactylosporangium sp. CS-047395]|uniref:AraC family transcriptional regulator n=1 Tax=Dactylosporangium sp. CS-047395 TaxID=3239936 RepID=UPI003D926FE5
MPVARHSRIWPSGGVHLWPSGATGSAHSHPRGHLVYAARGVLTIHTSTGIWIVPANRMAWIPPGSSHFHRAHGETDMRIVFLPPSLARRAPATPAVFLASALAREVLLALTGDRHFEPSARTRLHRVLVDELVAAPEQPLHLPEPQDDRLRALAAILAADPADTSDLTDLGRRVGASARTLSRLFHDELGMTFYEWRIQVRIAHALVLLAAGHSTTHVAHACGWSNPSGFIAAFTAVVGTTPGRHRSADLAHRGRAGPGGGGG